MRYPVYRYCLVDLSGTLHDGASVIPGAPDAIKLLRSQDREVLVRFLTNTSMTSRRKLLSQLRTIGFDEDCIRDESEIITAATAAALSIESRKLVPLCLVEDALLEDFEGMVAFGGGDGEEAAEFSPDCVLVGLAPSKFNYKVLNEAFRVLSGNPRAVLMAIHSAKFFKDSDGALSLGPGPFIAALEAASGKTCEVIGKPSEVFFRAALDSLGCNDPSECVMIGDDILGDIGGAAAVGMDGILVKTGKFLEKDASNGKVEPKLICGSIVDAVEFVLGPEIAVGASEEFVDDGGAPLSPREEKMAKEIQSLRNQLITIDIMNGKEVDEGKEGVAKQLFMGEPKEEEGGREGGGGGERGGGERGANDNKIEEGGGGGEEENKAAERKESADAPETPRAETVEDKGGGGGKGGEQKQIEVPPVLEVEPEPELDPNQDKKAKKEKKKKEEVDKLKERLKKFYSKYAFDESVDEGKRAKAKRKLEEGFDEIASKKLKKQDKLFEELVVSYGPE